MYVHFYDPDTKMTEELDRISGSSEANTPATATTGGAATATPKYDDRHFFGSNFNLEALAEVATLQQRPMGEWPVSVGRWFCFVAE